MRKTRWVPIATMLLASGCFDFGDLGSFGIGECCDPGIISSPGTTHLLAGDTIRLSVIFFPASATDTTRWTVGDSSFRALRFSDAPGDTAVLMAAERGSALVTASRGGAIASLLLNAHDSSDVSAVRISIPFPGATIPLAAPPWATDARLLVGSQVLGSHRPTWSSSDTTRAAIRMRAGTTFDPLPRAVIEPRSPGTVYVIAAWGTLRDSVSVTITP